MRWFPAWAWVPTVFSVGVLLFLPAIFCPLFLDDYLQAAMVRGTFPAKRGPFDLYNFIDDSVRRTLFEQGALPWWASPSIKLKFFRPLSSALLWFDHALLQRPVLMHLHSIAWWVAASLAARVLFRRLFPARVAAIAFAIFALAPCHALPLAWLANREALVALTFGTLGLVSYLRLREHGGWSWAAASAGFFSLAMLSGEYGLCIGGYVLAFEIVRRGEPLWKRVAGLLTFAVPAGAYLTLRQIGAYGARGSGFYTDPLVDAGAFLEAAPLRLLALVGDGWVGPDVDAYRPRWIVVPVVVSAMLALAWGPARRAFASLEPARRTPLSFMVVGSMFSLLPLASVTTSPRLLEVAMLGVAVGVACFLDFAWFGVVGLPTSAGARSWAERLTGIVALFVGFEHLVRGPVIALISASRVRDRAIAFVEHADFARDHLGEPPGLRLVFVRAPEEVFFLPFVLMAEGLPPPRLLALTDAPHVLLLSKGARTMNALVASDKSLVHVGDGSIFRDDASQLRKGTSVHVPGVRVTVLETGEAGPTSARFVFDEDYDSADLRWVTTGNSGLRTLDPPSPGFGLPVDP